MRIATRCHACGVKLPADRFEVAREEEATKTTRGIQLAARLRGDYCLSCTTPGVSHGVTGDECRPEGQRHGLGRTRS